MGGMQSKDTPNSAKTNSNANAGKSKQTRTFTEEEATRYKNVVVDGAVKEKITKLDGLINTFNNNNVKEMIVNMSSQDLYRDILTPELVGKVTDMHNKILAQIGDEKEIASNAALRNVMYKVVDEDTDKKLAAFLQDPSIGKNPLIKDEMKSLTSSIKNIGTRYKYFEYKYIQLNLFVIGFIQHVYETMSSFIETNMEYFEARENYRTELTLDFIAALKKLLEANDLNITDKEIDDLNKLMTAMKDDVNEKRKETKEKMQMIADANIKSINDYVEKYKENVYKEETSKAEATPSTNANVRKNASVNARTNTMNSQKTLPNAQNTSIQQAPNTTPASRTANVLQGQNVANKRPQNPPA